MKAHPFSPAGRAAALEQMARRRVDLLIVGGGITGCGLAREAALRGLRVALVEKVDFAFGTSSRSSKLVHGGIRYLQYFHIGLVRESARARQTIRRIAPHLVHPMPWVYPLYAGESMLKFRIGFWLFDWLAQATPAEQHRVLTPGEVRARVPGLRGPLKGGVVYGEYITDDARLTLENAMAAAEHGALVANHAPATGFLMRNGKVRGVRVRDELSGREYEAEASVVVNATGPWATALLQQSGFAAPKELIPSKGIHVLFPATRLPIESAVHLRTPSGREGLAIRRWDYVYVGTTDEPHHGELDGITADRDAVLDVLRMAQECFPSADLREDDVVATWAGLRPLIKEEGKSTREMSRHDEVWPDPAGLLTVAGGKLTTYRAMADRILAHVGRELGRRLEDDGRGARVPLPGADLGGRDTMAFRAWAQERLRAAGVAAETAERILWLYGGRFRVLLR